MVRKKGVQVSPRFMFALVCLFLISNFFCLFMGVLIGKDDLRWLKSSDEEADVGGSEPVSAIDNAVSVFEESDAARPEPIAVDYLDDSFREGAAKPAGQSNRPEPATGGVARNDAGVEETEVVDDPAQTAMPTPAANAPPASADRPVAKGGYFIQVFASKKLESAEGLRDKIIAKGYRAYLSTSSAGFHQVRMGPYVTKVEATVDKRRIKQVMRLDGWISKE